MNERELLMRREVDASLHQWREKEKTALELLRVVGELRFDHSIELVLFRRDIYDCRPSEVINHHRYASNYVGKPLSVAVSLELARAIARLADLAPAKIDLGKLGAEWLSVREGSPDVDQFVQRILGFTPLDAEQGPDPKDVVLYGFGRIGRLVARRIITQTGRGEQLRLKAIVVRPSMKDLREELAKRAALLQSDSVHGDFPGTVEIKPESSELIVNGNRIQLIYAANPAEIDYTRYGIKNALLIDNTGVWRDRDSLQVHLRPGIAQVLLTAPGKGIPNIVHGVNQSLLDDGDQAVFCAASCTTNAIVPVLKVVDETLGIERGHIETIHAYTSDQNLLDNFHKKPRRGRSAAINMVLTSTGAASAVTKVLPQLDGKLTGNSVRVPTTNVSLVILNLTLGQPTTQEQLNGLIRHASLHGDLVEQIQYSTSTEYVSSNAVGTTTTSVLDAPSTIISADGRNATLYLWYDNEFGYTCQVVRLAKHAAQVRRKVFY